MSAAAMLAREYPRPRGALTHGTPGKREIEVKVEDFLDGRELIGGHGGV